MIGKRKKEQVEKQKTNSKQQEDRLKPNNINNHIEHK